VPAGFYVLRGGADHLFVDCGPVGLAGRGGHGHNDALSFELALDGVTLVTDSGSYVYTADSVARNAFRSTAYHSTPQIDGAELNRFLPGELWTLHDDARPSVEEWEPDGHRPALHARHSGYLRLAEPVVVRRSFALDLTRHAAAVLDDFDGAGEHSVLVPWHLAAGATVKLEDGACLVETSGRRFSLTWSDGWEASLRDGWESQRYGVRTPRRVLELRREGPLRSLAMAFTSASDQPPDAASFVLELVAR
jgi:hypothetical protein